MERDVKVSKAVLKRLPGYLAYLKSMPDSAPANISATDSCFTFEQRLV